jgi:colanic acid/amylovoran biosynthesis glycosyltransferase
MRQVGIFCLEFPHTSRVFIDEQASHLTCYQPKFLMRSQLKEIGYQGVSVQDSDILGIKQNLFTLTRSPLLFKKSSSLTNLSLIHAHFGPDGIYALPLSKQLDIPLITTFHGYDITTHKFNFLLSKSIIDKQYLLNSGDLKKHGAVFIAVSRFIEAKLIEKEFPKEKIIQHYIGVDTQKFTPLAQKSKERYVLCVSRHVQKKGLETLLLAFSQIAKNHPDVLLIQVGAGPLTSKLCQLTEELGIKEQVRFIGAQPHQEVLFLMQNAEVFALPSQTARSGDSEALGIVFNEASACGIPIVSTLHGGIPEAVLHGETGFLSAEGDAIALAINLDALLSDQTLAKKMGHRGREFVCEKFDIYKQTAKLETIYEETTEKWKKR